MKRFFIGIDFSKLKFDIAVYDGTTQRFLEHCVFENCGDGFKKMLEWMKSITKTSSNEWLFCGEHTGLYSLALSTYLVKRHHFICLEPGLKIKQSKGMSRGKNDKIDAYNIAEYAYRFRDKMKPYCLRNVSLDQIKDLLSYRNRLIDSRKSFLVSSKEIGRVKSDDIIVNHICDDSQELISILNARIKVIEKKIDQILKADPNLSENYVLLTSIKGIGMVNAVLVLVFSGNFTLFSDPRSFGCYCGVVPFKHQSGSSIHGRERVSHLANKLLKVSLTQAARTAVMHDPIFKSYYMRKMSEGKSDKLVINNVRNKLIHTMFAVIRSREKYNEKFVHPLQTAA